MRYYNLSEKEVFSALSTSPNGLSESEAKKRLEKYGLNELKEKKKTSAFSIFLRQFNSFIVLILVAAVILSILVNEYIDAIVIAIVLALNSTLGFVQEYKAERSMEALKKFISLKAKVIRNSKESIIPASELVPGDLVILEEGSKTPADARITEAYSLSINESTLTGESTPVKKVHDALKGNFQIADQKNMVFSGTTVTSGIGKAIITSTGSNTEIGKIASLMQETEKEPTPLQKQLSVLSKHLSIITVLVCIFAFTVILLKGSSIADSLIFGVALAVAAIPEGLPAIVTIGLALGTQRMIKHNVLIRKLSSVETLGSTTAICADKTGTLTLNKMTVTSIYANSKVTSSEKITNDSNINLLLKIGVLCNNATLSKKSSLGDPTEIALLAIAGKIGLRKEPLSKSYKRIHEIPFSSERKMMSTINSFNGKSFMFTKGAPDTILKYCTKICINNKVLPLTKELKNNILKANEEFANQALRVLGFAYKEAKDYNEKGLVFVGLQGMIDPPRKEVKKSIEQCKKAGIKVIMITGDHKLTAEAIASEIGINGMTMTGEDLDKTKDLSKIVEQVSIYARVNPLHKLRIVDALKKKGHVVAMTGDGVNDAPALKRSDIGIAVNSGTDVSKEASDMILLDNNFSSIVNAIKEGRAIYNNIIKFILYLLSSNIGEVLIIFTAVLIGLPLPLIALQILWINLVTDGLPALALSIDPMEKNIMDKKPRSKKDSILSKYRILLMATIGIIMAAGTLLLFKKSLANSYAYATTIAFTSVVFYEMFNVLSFKSETSSVINKSIFNNKYLILAILSSIALQLLVIYTPLSSIFETSKLPLNSWLIIIAMSSSSLIVLETIKRIFSKSKC